MVRVPVLDMPALPGTASAPRSPAGRPLREFVSLDGDERVLCLTSLSPDSAGLALGTAQGVVKRVLPDVPAREDWDTRTKPADRSGSAGSPETSAQTVSARVTPNESAIATQVGERAQPEPCGGRQEEREEEHVRQPELSRGVLPEYGEGDAEGIEDLGLLLDDVLRRPACDREDVHRRDEDGDEQDEPDAFEELEEPPPEQRDRNELRLIRDRVGAGELQEDRGRGEPECNREEAPGGQLLAEGEREQEQGERHGDEHETDEDDVPRGGDVREVLRPRVVGGERGEQR